METLKEKERTRDIYEQISAYPKPPLIPIPGPNELETLKEMGIKLNTVSRAIAKVAMAVTGFRSFQKQLPNKLEKLLRQTNLRGAGLFALINSATLALKDDSRPLSPIDRAVTLLFAARSLFDDIKSGKLEPDQYRGEILEMGQYPNLFSTGLTIDGKRAWLCKSKEKKRITVIVGGRYFLLEIGELGSETSFEQVRAALTAIVEKVKSDGSDGTANSPGKITSASHATQVKIFQKLQQLGNNKANISELRHSFLTLCLDLDRQPATDAKAAMAGQVGNYANRWYHSSLQIVVFGNAKACTVCSFNAYVDGNTMMRGTAEIQNRAEAYPVNGSAEKSQAKLPAAKELKWTVNPPMLKFAQRDINWVRDNQQATFEIQGIDRKYFNSQNIAAVPTFIVAIQMAIKQVSGKTLKISQFLSLSKYRCMDLTSGVVTTDDVIRFMEYLENGNTRPEQARELLKKAIESQAQECRKARKHLALPKIFSLFLVSRSGFQQIYVSILMGITILFLKIFGLFKSAMPDVLVSHPEIYPQVPVVGRPGIRLPYVNHFGLHYQILDNKTVITMMPGLKWNISNTKLIAAVEQSLNRIKSAIGEN